MATLAMTNIDTLLDHAINDEGAKINFCVLKEFLTSLVGVLDVGGVEVNAPTLLAFGDSSSGADLVNSYMPESRLAQSNVQLDDKKSVERAADTLAELPPPVKIHQAPHQSVSQQLGQPQSVVQQPNFISSSRLTAVSRRTKAGGLKMRPTEIAKPQSMTLIGDHLKLMSLSKQVESNESQIAKMRDVLDSLAMTTAESLERSRHLETRFDDDMLETLDGMKNKTQVNEQIDQLETSVAVLQANLKEELSELKNNVPTWQELNEIAKAPAERSASGNDGTIKQREMVHWSNTFWTDHSILTASIDTNATFQSEIINRLGDLSHELNTQMDAFDTNLTNLQVDTENEQHRIVRSHENLRQVVIELGLQEQEDDESTDGENKTRKERSREKKRRAMVLEQKSNTSTIDLGLKVMVEDMIMPLRDEVMEHQREAQARLDMHNEKLVNMEVELATLAKSLQFLRDSVRSRQSLTRVINENVDNPIEESNLDGLERIQDSIVELESRHAKMKLVLTELMDSDRSKHDSLDSLQALLNDIRGSMITHDTFDQVINGKVNRDEFADTVNKAEFEAEIEKFSLHLNEFSTKLADEEIRGKVNTIDDSVLETMCNKNYIEDFTRQFEKRLAALRSMVQKQITKSASDSELVDAAGAKKRLLKCLSCDKKATQSKTAYGSVSHSISHSILESSLPHGPAMPMNQSIRPYTSYQLGNLRQNPHQRQRTGFDTAIEEKNQYRRLVYREYEKERKKRRSESAHKAGDRNEITAYMATYNAYKRMVDVNASGNAHSPSSSPAASGRACGGQHTVGLIPSNSRTGTEHHHLNRAMSTQSAKIYHLPSTAAKTSRIIDDLTRRPTTASSENL